MIDFLKIFIITLIGQLVMLYNINTKSNIGTGILTITIATIIITFGSSFKLNFITITPLLIITIIILKIISTILTIKESKKN